MGVPSRGTTTTFPFGREGVNLLRVQIDLQRRQELVGIGHVALPLDQLPHPGQALLVARADRRAAGFVLPVRRDAFFRDAVHLVGADLHLELVAALAHHGCVQRLIQIRPRHGDEVLDAPRNRPPDAVDDAEDGVAVLHAGGDHAQRQQVVDLVDGGLRLRQLLVDAVEPLDAPLHAGLDVVLVQAFGEQTVDPGQELFAFGAPRFDGLVQLLPRDGIDPAKGQVLQLAAQFAHAQAMRQRRVNVERLPGDGALPLRRQVFERAHIVEPVGQLDEHHAHIAHHGQEHFADVLRLAVFAVRELDLVDLGDALDDVRHLLAELGDDVLGRDRRILDRVMQQPRGDGGGVQLHLRQHQRDLQRMQNVGLPGGAQLPVMVFQAELPGVADDVDVVGGAIGVNRVQQLAELLPEQVRDPLNLERGGLDTRHDPL